SALYDKAFDKGLIAINEDFKILLSKDLKKKHKHDYYSKYFLPIENMEIAKPQRYTPNKEFIQYHLDSVFEK
ncbi:MAG: hypothetical protein RL065_1696, partial [Bacteroidota bacterium]